MSGLSGSLRLRTLSLRLIGNDLTIHGDVPLFALITRCLPITLQSYMVLAQVPVTTREPPPLAMARAPSSAH
jgi:hypothetical protein